MKTRAEHIAWCKERAIFEMQQTRDPKQAVMSMASDLRKHPETRDETLQALCMQMLLKCQWCGEDKVREFINDFN